MDLKRWWQSLLMNVKFEWRHFENPQRLLQQLRLPEDGQWALKIILNRDDAVPLLLSVFTWRRDDGEGGIDQGCTCAFYFAIEGLVRLQAREAVGDLIYLLYYPDTAVRVKAIQALGDFGDPRARDSLIPFFR